MKKQINYFERVVVLVIGVFIIAFGATLLVKSDIGGDSILVLQEGFTHLIGLDISKLGTGILILNSFLIIVLFFMNKRMVNIGTFVISLLMGPLVTLYLKIPFLVTPDTFLFKFIVTITGIVISSLGVAIYIFANVGYSPYEGIILTIKDKFNLRFAYVKIAADIAMFSIGAILGGTFGVGSIMTIILFGPLIDIFGKLINLKLTTEKPQ